MLKIFDIVSFLSEEKIPYIFHGDENVQVTGFSSLTNYKEGTFTWIKRKESIPNNADLSKMALVFTSEEMTEEFSNVIYTPQPKQAFFSTIEHFYARSEEKASIGQFSVISPEVKVGANVSIGNNCTLKGKINIGDDCIIGDNVTMIGPIMIGTHCEIRSGVRIGYDDSIAYFEDKGHRVHIKHFGGVSIGCNTLIGENSCICRGTIDDTTIGNNVLLDALTHISHNCKIEDDVVMISGSRLYGSVTVRKKAYIASAIIRNQCTIGEEAMIGMGSVVTKDVANGVTVVGNPAKKIR